MLNRQISAKKAWARLSERAECGEKFGFIACLGLLYKGGILTRAQVIEELNSARITRDDLRKFDAQRRDPAQSGQVRREIGPNFVSKAGESAQICASSNPTASPAPHASADVFCLPLRP
jgi:hypothetical protein